jgi:hypothetical protein
LKSVLLNGSAIFLGNTGKSGSTSSKKVCGEAAGNRSCGRYFAEGIAHQRNRVSSFLSLRDKPSSKTCYPMLLSSPKPNVFPAQLPIQALSSYAALDWMAHDRC